MKNSIQFGNLSEERGAHHTAYSGGSTKEIKTTSTQMARHRKIRKEKKIENEV